MRSFQASVTAAVLVAASAHRAGAETVTFESFGIGDGLAQVNAATAPLGFTFDAANPSSFQVVQHPGDPEGKVIAAEPHSAAGAVGIVINFAVPVDFVQAEFIGHPGKIAVLEIYQAPQTAAALVVVPDYVGQVISWTGPGVLRLAWTDRRSPPSRLYAGTMDRGGLVPGALTYVDNVAFTFSGPLGAPPSILLLGFGLGGIAGLGLRRRNARGRL